MGWFLKAAWGAAFAGALLVCAAQPALSQKRLPKAQQKAPQATRWAEEFQTAIHSADHEAVTRIIALQPSIVKTRFVGDRTCLHLAAEMFLPLCGIGDKTNEYRDVLKILVESSADPNAVDKRGNPPLFTLAATADAEAVEYLLRNGADPLATNVGNQNVLHCLAQLPIPPGALFPIDVNASSRRQLAKKFLEHGCDIDAVDLNRCTPLHAALGSTSGIGFAKWLLENDADVGLADNYGVTALHGAVMLQDEGLVKMMLGRGANPRSVSDVGGTPVSIALRNSSPVIRDVFAKRGITPTVFDLAAGGIHQQLIECLGRNPLAVNARDALGATPLHYAALCGKINCVNSLLQAGAVIDAKDNAGGTALHVAVRSKVSEPEKAAIVARLIKQHADVNAKNENGETALHISASRRTIELNAPLLVDGSSSIVAELVDAGADIHAVDRNGDTPLHRAVANGLDWTCEILVSAGADAKRVNHDKMTPLDIARKRQSSTLVQLLTTSAERLSDRNLVRPPRRR